MNIQAELRKMIKPMHGTCCDMDKAMGIDRGSLYKSLKDGSNLEFNTLMRVWGFLGTVFILTFLLSLIVACATVPKGPVMPEEVRLIHVMISEIGPREEGGKHYKGVAEYQRGEKVKTEEISEACLTFYQRA